MNRLQLGASSYFSGLSNTLDPHLFEGDHLKPHVRQTINNLLLGYLGTRYNNPSAWSMVWLAGSGITYQWSANRGNGDLDVLFGIDYSQFVTDNPEYSYMDRHEITEAIDNDLKKSLWPSTSGFPFPIASQDYGDMVGPVQEYEITFFLNDNIEAEPNSIVNIHPYAAYNVTTDEWTIKPPNKGGGDMSFPVEYEQKVEENRRQAEQLVARHNYLMQQLSATPKNSPQWHNYESSMKLLVSFIKTMYAEIHLGRKNAFSNQGEGYGDFYNYQWQAAKRDGIVTAFNEILNMEH